MQKRMLRDQSKIKDVLFTGIFVLGVTFLRLFYIKRTTGPFIYTDELGYWSHAAHMTGHTWAGVMDGVSWYSFGYSFWLALTFFLSDRMSVMYHIAILINLCMGLAMFALVYRIIQRLLPEHDTLIRGFLAFAITSYPTYIFYSYTTLTETLFALIVWMLFYELVLLEEHPNWMRALALGCTASYGFMVHNRMLAVLVAIAVCVLILWIRHKVDWKHILLIAISAGVLFVVYLFLKDFLSVTIVHNKVVESTGETVSQGTYNTFEFVFRKFSRMFKWRNIEYVLLNVMGQIWECISSSYMLAGLGIMYSVKKLGKKEDSEECGCLYIFPLASLVCSTGLTGVSAYGSSLQQVGDKVRIDHAFFGRYNAPIIPLLILLACVMLLRNEYKLAWKNYAGMMFVYLPVSVGVFVRVHGIENGYLNIVSAVAIHIFHWLGEFSVIKCAVIAIVVGAVFIGFCCVRWKSRWNYCAAFLMLIFLFSTTALYCMRTSIRGENDNTARYTSMFSYLAENTQKDDIVYICQDGKMSYDLQTRLVDRVVVCTVPERLAEVQDGTYVVIPEDLLGEMEISEYADCLEIEEYVVIRTGIDG